MTKIDIISGFLGAGKTTLIKKLIQDVLHKENIVLIENEFGEIGIDGGFLQDAGIEVKEMNSGCICCSLVGDFSLALKKVLEEYHPDRIIIEPSGVGKLSDVIKAVQDLKDISITINSTTAVVDANKCCMYMKNFGEFFNNQIEHANAIILSRSQQVNDEKLQKIVREITHHNAHATILSTAWDKLQGEDILSAMEHADVLERELMEAVAACPSCGHHHEHEEHHHHEHDTCTCGHDHHDHDAHDDQCTCGHAHHHADEVFVSWGCETPRKYTRDELNHILLSLSNKEVYGTILRAKGMLETSDGTWMYFDYVPEEYEVRDGKPTYTGRFCVIGAQLQNDALQALFQVA